MRVGSVQCSQNVITISNTSFPVTRELQLVSMSVGPRYSRAVLVKRYPIDDTLSIFDESCVLESTIFPTFPLISKGAEPPYALASPWGKLGPGR